MPSPACRNGAPQEEGEEGGDPARRSVPPETTRRERLRRKAQAKLEKQLRRLHAIETRRKGIGAPDGVVATAPSSDCPDSAPSRDSPITAAAAPPTRHSDRFVNGTFWKVRKERKKRTLFLGNIPAADLHHGRLSELLDALAEESGDPSVVCEALVASVPRLAGEEEATTSPDRYGDSGEPPSKRLRGETHSHRVKSIVDAVDVVGGGADRRRRSDVGSAYVCFKTVAAAKMMVPLLDGLVLAEGSRPLRCNFSSDKNQRTIAIQKRGK